MKLARTVSAAGVAILMVCSTAMAQQMMTGTISKVDEAGGKIAIQQAQSGTVGANTAGAAEDFKVQDGLMFNAFQVGDKVSFTASDVGGVKTITKLQKQ
jgi:Cu/Ag efflux protein CusF